MYPFGEFWGIVHCNCGYTGVFLELHMNFFSSLSFEKLNLVHLYFLHSKVNVALFCIII